MRQPAGGEAGRCTIFQHREDPGRVVVVEGGQRQQRLGLAQRSQPAAHAAARVPLPAFQQPEQVKAPERRRLDENEQDRPADVGQGHQPLQLVHLAVGAQPFRGERRLNLLQGRRRELLAGEHAEHAAIGGEDPLPRRHLGDLFVHLPAKGEAEGQVDHQHGDQRGRGRQAQQRGDKEDQRRQRQQARRPEQGRALRQPARLLGPGDELLVLRLRRFHEAAAHRHLLAQFDPRGQFRRGGLARAHCRAVRGREQPAAQRRPADGRGGRAQQLLQPGAAQDIEVGGGCGIDLCSAILGRGGCRRQRQPVPAARQPVQPLLVERGQGGHAPLLAGQPVAIDQRCYERHETQEGKRRERIVAVPHCDRQQRQRTEKEGQADIALAPGAAVKIRRCRAKGRAALLV